MFLPEQEQMVLMSCVSEIFRQQMGGVFNMERYLFPAEFGGVLL